MQVWVEREIDLLSCLLGFTTSSVRGSIRDPLCGIGSSSCTGQCLLQPQSDFFFGGGGVDEFPALVVIIYLNQLLALQLGYCKLVSAVSVNLVAASSAHALPQSTNSGSVLTHLRWSFFATMVLQQCEDLEACLAVAIDAAQKAGQVILNNFHSAKHVEHKGMVDLVTETDKACEDLIFTQLKLTFPSHELIGEETSAENGTPVLTDAPTWVVDPLDGTTNFVHKFPFVCVSIGLVINKVPVVGVVYNPIMGELFTAIQGKGAHLNGQRIRASSQEKIGTAILATEVGTIRDKKTVDRTTNMINNLLFQVRSVRMSGSCAMNLCGVACGRLDMFYEIGFGGPWDVAGGALIVQEAGGHVFDPSGGDFDLMARRIASSNAHLKQALVAAIAG